MEYVVNKLKELQDLEFKAFHTRLIPGTDEETVIGVRTPAMRSFAKEFSKDKRAENFLSELPHKYYEEYLLHAFLIDYMKQDFDETVAKTEEFLPYIDNWAICDAFNPKIFKKNKASLYEKALQWLGSNHTYTVRFAIVTLMRHFLDEDFKPEILTKVGEVKSDEYYINMAIAWFFSFALIKQYDDTISWFENQRMDKWVHNKSIQKAIESYRISKERKDYLRSLKIK